ncbi:MAG: hypothetical protein ACR2Q4_17530 [Geminicoccaceae bacterium]
MKRAKQLGLDVIADIWRVVGNLDVIDWLRHDVPSDTSDMITSSMTLPHLRGQCGKFGFFEPRGKNDVGLEAPPAELA